jgi:hypothetical protein
MGDPARESDPDRPSAGKAPATDAEPTEAKVAEPRKSVSGEPPNIEEQDPPLEATDSEDVYDDDDDMEDTDEYSAASVTVRSSIWEHEFEGGRRVCIAVLFCRQTMSLILSSITTIDTAAILYQTTMKSRNEST